MPLCLIPATTVQMMLGHKNITTTKIYADVGEEKLEDDTQGWEETIERRKEITLAAQQLQERQITSIQTWAT